MKGRRNRVRAAARSVELAAATAPRPNCPEMGFGSFRNTAAAGQGTSQPSNAASIVISAFINLEIGQPDFAACAALSNLAKSAPGTLARTTR
jgi:hypothetical protein